jgi:hypothetical protein
VMGLPRIKSSVLYKCHGTVFNISLYTYIHVLGPNFLFI